MIKNKIFLAVVSLSLVCLVGWSSHNYGLKLTSYPQTKAATKYSRPPYLTKEERDEYKAYLMSQKNGSAFMLWNEWKLSKVFKKTLTQLEKESKDQ